jgi:glycosyltransferase involved in cell wall biosynthesis
VRTGVDLAEHYASGDLFLFSSLTETFGNVTLEAMASGLPVLAFDYAAAAELIRHPGDGLKIARGDEDGFVRSAAELAVDAARMKQMARRAREIALTHDWRHVNDAFAAALSDAAERHYRLQNAHAKLVVALD